MFRRMLIAGATVCLLATGASAAEGTAQGICSTVPSYGALQTALAKAVSAAHNLNQAQSYQIGFSLNMWATIVAADGTVCAVAYSGSSATQGQWLASRLISAEKATTANSLSLGQGNGPAVPALGGAGFAISTANLFSATQPGGSLFGLQASNPQLNFLAYGDNAGIPGQFPPSANTSNYGTASDPMVGLVTGGLNVFGGGLALYSSSGRVGGVGVSGDTSCLDHIVAWFLRRYLSLDYLSTANVTGFAFVAASDTAHPDNIIYDIPPGGVSASGYGHPVCAGAGGPLTYTAAEALVKGSSLPAVR